MKTEIFNENNLTINEIDETVTRVKVFLVNNENKVIIANANGCYQLPGGHIEENEEIVPGVKREIQEETGIVLDDSEIPTPFYERQTLKRNHRNSGKNRLSKIIYFYIKTNKAPNLTNINLTEHEKENNFYVDLIPFNKVETILQNVMQDVNSNEFNKNVAEETLYAFKILKENLK